MALQVCPAGPPSLDSDRCPWVAAAGLRYLREKRQAGVRLEKDDSRRFSIARPKHDLPFAASVPSATKVPGGTYPRARKYGSLARAGRADGSVRTVSAEAARMVLLLSNKQSSIGREPQSPWHLGPLLVRRERQLVYWLYEPSLVIRILKLSPLV